MSNQIIHAPRVVCGYIFSRSRTLFYQDSDDTIIPDRRLHLRESLMYILHNDKATADTHSSSYIWP